MPRYSALNRRRVHVSLPTTWPRRRPPNIDSRSKNPWEEYSAAYLAAIGVFYCSSTKAVMMRGLSRISEAFLELKAEGKVTTTNPKKIRFDDMLAFMAWMRTCPGKSGNGIKSSTQDNYFVYLVGLLRWIENPVVQEMEMSSIIRLPRREPPEIVVLSERDLKSLQNRLKAMPGWNGCVARFMTAMYAYSGLRRSELRLASLADLDTKTWTFRVAHQKVQSGWLASNSLTTILPPARRQVHEFLKERKKYLRDNGLGEREPLVPRILRDGSVAYWSDALWGKVKGEAQLRAGIPFQIRQLRSTFAQMCKDRGASLEAVSRVLRHRSIVTTELFYARIRPEAAFQELEGLFVS